MPFGSLLIKQVVEDLKKNLPRIRTFATLSPIPGFRKVADASCRIDRGRRARKARKVGHADEAAFWSRCAPIIW